MATPLRGFSLSDCSHGKTLQEHPCRCQGLDQIRPRTHHPRHQQSTLLPPFSFPFHLILIHLFQANRKHILLVSPFAEDRKGKTLSKAGRVSSILPWQLSQHPPCTLTWFMYLQLFCRSKLDSG